MSGHVCTFEDFTVFLNYDLLKFKRLIKESLHVTKKKQDLLNKQVKSQKLELFWFNSTYAILLYLRWFVIM